MTSEKRVQKFHTDDLSLPWSRWCFWLVEADFPRCMTNQKWNVISMESLRSFLRHHFAGKPAVASGNSAVFSGCWRAACCSFLGICGILLFKSTEKFSKLIFARKKILFQRVSISLELCKLCEICRRNHTSFVKVPHRTLCVFSQSKSKCGLVGNIHGGHHANCKTLGIPE